MACCTKPKIYSQSDPLVVGEPNSDAAVNVVATVNVGGLRTGRTSWVTGSHVAALIAQGWFVEVS